MIAPKLRFSRGLKAKAPGAVTARVPAPTPLVEIFTGPAPIDWTQEATMVKVRIFFLTSRVFQVYDYYFTNVLTQRSCFEVLLTADSQCFSRDNARTFVPTIPRRRRAFTGTSRSSFTILRAAWSFFFHPPSPSPVSSPGQSPLSFPLPSLSTRRNPLSLLDRRRHESHQTYSSYQFVSHLGTSSMQVPAIWTKSVRSIEELFFSMKKMKKAQEKQAAINVLTKKTPRRHARTTTSVAGRWQMAETKLRLDVYIRPWPPGWSFSRRIYTRPVAVNGLMNFMGTNCRWRIITGRLGSWDVFRKNKYNTVKPVLSDHPTVQGKMVAIDRWSLKQGFPETDRFFEALLNSCEHCGTHTFDLRNDNSRQSGASGGLMRWFSRKLALWWLFRQ